MSQRLNSFFTGSPELRDLAHKARQLAAAQRAYCKATPPTLARASRVIGFERCTLTVGADNSAVAAKLRQLAPQLLHHLHGDGMEVNGILVKVQVSQPTPERIHRPFALEEDGRRRIAEAATGMKDSPLKRALQRLIGNKKD